MVVHGPKIAHGILCCTWMCKCRERMDAQERPSREIRTAMFSKELRAGTALPLSNHCPSLIVTLFAAR